MLHLAELLTLKSYTLVVHINAVIYHCSLCCGFSTMQGFCFVWKCHNVFLWALFIQPPGHFTLCYSCDHMHTGHYYMALLALCSLLKVSQGCRMGVRSKGTKQMICLSVIYTYTLHLYTVKSSKKSAIHAEPGYCVWRTMTGAILTFVWLMQSPLTAEVDSWCIFVEFVENVVTSW